jgi:glycosyltransferase involved in cell wall biosynthesis
LSLTTPPFIGIAMVPFVRRENTAMVNWTMDLYPEIAVALGFVREESFLHRLLKRVAKTIYGHSDSVVTLGDVMASALRDAGIDPAKIRVVQNWVPARSVSYTPPHANADKVTLMYHGNLGLGHQLDSAIKAVSKLEDRSRLQVRMVGDGKMRIPLRQLAEQLGLDNVRFFPPCPLSELSGSLAGGDIHLISQRPGTQGLLVPSKLYSILAAGRPTIYIGPEGTEAASVVKESRSGILVDAGDVEAIACALTQLADDSALRLAMGERARQYYDAHCGEAGNSALIADITESAIKKE